MPRLALLLLAVLLALPIQGEVKRYVVDVNTRLNIRDDRGAIVGKLYNGDTIEVHAIENGWARIAYIDRRDGMLHTGQVSAQYLIEVEEPAAATQKQQKQSHKSSSHWYSSFWLWAIVIFILLKTRHPAAIARFLLHVPWFVFYLTNQLQHFLQKPWRWMLHDPADWVVKCHRCYVWVLPTVVLYLAIAPLRLLNAAYFNVVDRTIHAMFDSLGEIFYPTALGMDEHYGWSYQWRWAVGLPLRILYYLLRLGVVAAEGLLYTAFDTLVPTLTLYHGTSPDAAQNITEANDWQVGNGAYAGYGIYFGSTLRTANNYAQGVVVVSRVSLGRIENLNLHYYMRTLPSYHGLKGHRITQWAQDNHITTIEWWREDSGWWEYCMVDHGHGYDNPWRIRPLYVIKECSDTHHRIEGCVRLWLIPTLLDWARKLQ